ncbi:MAG TPA: fused MFS/spermidine synthase [Pyrinomonadaceae bacterium]|nr:fused MFS/spermidine synthase [Pyrinomonadaceae bacterium]
MTDSSVPSSKPAVYSQSTIYLIGLCFVLSGATGLIYEVLWARMLGLVFGATTLAVSTVLAAFMGGLALGSTLAGRFGPRLPRPLSAYGWLEVGIAVYALCVPIIFALVDRLYVLIWQQFHPDFFAFSVWRFVLSCLLLLVPTTLMGATLPVLSAALLDSAGHKRSSVATLYTCNLAGAIIGTLLAGFVLLPMIGVSKTIWFAASLNALVGLVAIIAQRKYSPIRKSSVVVQTDTGSTLGTGVWLLAAFVSGFVTISSQVSWTRILTMVIGSSTYAFSLVVALFLIGLAAGASLVSRFLKDSVLRNSLMKVELLTTATLVISLYVVNLIPALVISLGLNLKINSWAGLLSLQVLAASLLVLLPALLMGMIMPLVLVWASGDEQHAVNLVGQSYAVNTVGAIIGAFTAGFVLIPKLSTRFTILFAATTCLIVAGIAYQPGEKAKDPALRKSIVAGAIPILIIAMFFVFAPQMNKADLSIGAYDSLIRILAKSREGGNAEGAEQGRTDNHKLLMYNEGPTATVSVRDDLGTISLAINGRTNASDSDFDMPTQVMLSQLPLLVAPKIDNALIIGFATGISVGSLLQSPIESVTCLELETATIAASRFFNHVNHLPLDDPRTHLIIDDARTFLRVTPNKYDMIISEPSHPWVPGVANLFTKEFFELSRERLSDEGVFVQWVQVYQLSTESLQSVLATYHSVFPHVLMFRVGGPEKGKDLILIGGKQRLDLNHLSARFADPRMAAETGRVELKSEKDVRDWFVCDETRLGPAVRGARINTDDNMLIETTVPREAFRPLMQSNSQWVSSLAVEK